ncbi:D-alanyl-D-alanine carboxypeptidase/D-alanyl-D-alanine-endopeptidase [Ignavibacterium sp.]|uniref:D-alanyl-D-alanine carboxypeptidase/D-alanyl-D-alanine endopeptidase n=1 Tax=Ignavibacterium sp. TaxID=2651167 RepID=UPI00307F8DF2
MIRSLTIAVLFIFTETYAQDTIKYTPKDTTAEYDYLTISELQQKIDNILSDSNFINANWGVVIRSLQTGEYLYNKDESKLFVPASNLKLFTTAAGLSLLGSGYRYTTNIYSYGDINYSTLEGDLIIQGTGDPTFSGRFYNGDIFKVFDDWADSLINLGITKIQGNIIGDDDLFDDQGLGEGWSWDYETYWYAAQSSAISFNDNCIDISICYDSKLDSIIIKYSPVVKGIIVINDVVPVSPGSGSTDIDIYRERGTNIITVSGTFSKGSDTLKTYATVLNPTLYAMIVLQDRLEKKGIKVSGYAIDIDDYGRNIDYTKVQYLFSYFSPYLFEIVKVINKGSQNFFAEQLLKTIGHEKKGFGSAENGIIACKEWFSEIGLNPDHIIMTDGSGLSHLNRVTPQQIILLLRHMYSTKIFGAFFNSLPIAGVDGTLLRRMKNTKAENSVRAKTGFISFARSLSGYAFTGDGEPLAFSFIVNNFNVPVKLAENLQDSICVLLSNFKRKSTE